MITAKRTIVSIVVAAALVLFPAPFYGQGLSGGVPGRDPLPTPSANQMSATSPPVAPPLVPEGVFAVQLVEALKIGQAQDEAQAETMLSAVGIEPRNGWIAGYPVTPDIAGEIEKSVTASADAKTLQMGRDEAQKAVENLSAKLGLNIVPAYPSPSAQAAPVGNVPIYRYMDGNGVLYYTDRYDLVPKEYRDQLETIGEEAPPQPYEEPAGVVAETPVDSYAANPTPEVINNYYYNDGPPVVTYYAPPAPYYYLYAWVPYPFRCSGFFFPGFFILRDFHRHIIFNRHPFEITNHVVHGVNKTVSVINPVTRANGGRIAANGVTSPRVVASPSARAGAPATPPNTTYGQNRPGQGPNVTRITPSAVNRGTTSTITPPTVSTSPRAEPPAIRGGSFSQAPRAQVSNPPSARQHIGVFSSSSGRVGSSFRSSAGSSSFTGHSSFAGGSFGGRPWK